MAAKADPISKASADELLEMLLHERSLLKASKRRNRLIYPEALLVIYVSQVCQPMPGIACDCE